MSKIFTNVLCSICDEFSALALSACVRCGIVIVSLMWLTNSLCTEGAPNSICGTDFLDK